MVKIERVDERTVRAYFDALDPLVRRRGRVSDRMRQYGIIMERGT